MLGRTTIENLLPHRPPFLMVESVVSYVGGDAPTLNAMHPIRRSEPVFSGAELPLYWPSMYIIEGLGQCINLLSLIWTCERRFVAKGYDAENFGKELMNMEANNGDGTSELLLQFFGEGIMKTFSRIGLLALVDVELTGRVSAGELLSYKVQQTRVHGELSHFTVSAHVGEQVVARGTLVGAGGGRLEGKV